MYRWLDALSNLIQELCCLIKFCLKKHVLFKCIAVKNERIDLTEFKKTVFLAFICRNIFVNTA